MNNQSLVSPNITENVNLLQGFMKHLNLDAFVISSNDFNLNEYTPLPNNRRYFLSGMTGSTAEMLIPKQGKPIIVVDGRYHDQADSECLQYGLEVYKAQGHISLEAEIIELVRQKKFSVVAVEGDRSRATFVLNLKNACQEVVSFDQQELDGLIPLSHQFNVDLFLPQFTLNSLIPLTNHLGPAKLKERLARVFEQEVGVYFTIASDTLAWISGLRCLHYSNQMSFPGMGFLSAEELVMWVPAFINITSALNTPNIVIYHSEELFWKHLSKTMKNKPCLHVSKSQMNYAYWNKLHDMFTKKVKVSEELIHFQAQKTTEELVCYQLSFKKSSIAIRETIETLKSEFKNSPEKLSEQLVAKAIEKSYQKQGAITFSFHTISAMGKNAAIMHYGKNDPCTFSRETELILLDSGAYYQEGVPTDCTRTFALNPQKIPTLTKRYYTLVLMGLIDASLSIFPDGTLGNYVDALARQYLYAEGLDFNHGTGHGIGPHVHEAGARISKLSQVPLRAGQVVSIEPGYYQTGKLGIRLENVVAVVPASYPGFLQFQNLIYTPFEEELVQRELLTERQWQWFSDYQTKSKNLS